MFKNKKLLVALSMLFIIFVVAACGGSDEEEGASNDQSGGEETAQDGDVDNGEDVYDNNCMSCHGDDGKGQSGPDLTGESDFDEVVEQVEEGGDTMPAFKDDLSEEEINDVSTYIIDEVAG